MKGSSTRLLTTLVLLTISHFAHADSGKPPNAAGPLWFHPPRYFTNGTQNADGSLKAIYLTDSHHWNNLQDSTKIVTPLPEKFDYDGYLRLLEKFNNNTTHYFTPPTRGDWVLLLRHVIEERNLK